MDRPMLKKFFFQALVWAGLIALCGVVALAHKPGAASAQAAAPAVESRTDGQIEMDVVHALDAAQALKNDLITAATIQSEVTLSGTVSSEANRELAESIASHVAGVTKMHNNLTVGNPQAAANAANLPMSGNESDDSQAPIPPPPPAEGPQATPGQSPYPSQPQAQPGQPQYGTANPRITRMRPPAYETPSGPVTVSKGTLLELRTSEPVSSKRAKDGTPVEFTVIRGVAVGGVLAIPRGATVHGVVTEVKKAGQLTGSPELALTLTSLDLGGQSYPLQTRPVQGQGAG